MSKKRITVRQLKELMTAPGFSGLPSDTIVCRAEPFEVVKAETPDGESLVRTFIASTSTPDREGDSLSVTGWDVDNYRRGGSVLYGHDTYSTPAHVVGKPLATWVEGNALKNRIEFTPKEVNPTGYMVYRLVAGGYLRSSSVGFMPKEWKEVSDRPGYMPIDFLKQELLEHSIVPVPANPECLDEAKGLGIDLSPMVTWAEKMLDEKSEILMVTRDLVEGAWKMAKAPKTTVVLPAPPVKDEALTPSESDKALHGEGSTSVQPTVDEQSSVGADKDGSLGGGSQSALQSEEQPQTKDVQVETKSDIVELVKAADESMAKAVAVVTKQATELVESIKAIHGALGKAGRVLSASNEDKLRQARDLLTTVIAQVESPEDEESTEPERKSDPVQTKSGEIDFNSPEVLQVIGDVVGDLFDRKLRQLRGKPE
jgi:hypothetical protein